ncbi:MAG: hypothetical protein AB8B95_12790 [Pseudohongiellaceae bacterium]
MAGLRKSTLPLVILLAALVNTNIVLAQDTHPEHGAVVEVVDQFFEGLNTDNQALLASISIDGANIYSLRERADSKFELRTRRQDNSTLTPNNGEYTERYWDETVLVSDMMAVFWAPYDFYVNGEFSHCGIDVFDLIKLDGEWKISNTMYTVIRDNCPDSPLGAL